MIYKIATALVLCASATALYTDDHVHQKTLWESFKTEFKKEYQTMEEEQKRFTIFLENIKMADLRSEKERKAGGSAVHGITRFSDISQAEFEARYLTADISMKTDNKNTVTYGAPNPALGEVNWAGKYTTPVKDQGYCGSCWAFSATEQIESDSMRTLGTNFILSPEQITQCDKTSYGCSGGWTEHAYNYVNRAGGLETNSNYPYTSADGTTGSCHSEADKFVVKVKSYTTISGEDSMATYVQSTGPLSVCVDANTWNSYNGGIVTTCGQSVDHCVQAVGVEATAGGYWIVRNSWGTGWGEGGYIRLSYGHNTCAIASDPTWVDVSL
jgi:C1A family cysteine protease